MAKTAAARKGDNFEALVQAYLRDHLGPQVCRPRPGELHDRGDFGGIPAWALQAKCYTDVLRAIREGLAGAAEQKATAGATYAGVIVKRPRVAAVERQLFVCELGDAVPLIRETARWGTP